MSEGPISASSEHVLPGNPCAAAHDRARWFAEKVHRHDAGLRSYLRGTFPAVRDVDDVVSESYLRVWKRQAARPIASARAFLFTVARHLALDHLRKQRRSPITAVADLSRLEVIEAGPCGLERACQREEAELLLAAVDELPARAREIYIMRKFEGLSQAEIAARLSISPKTVETQIGRANKHCERFLRSHGVRLS